MSFSKSTTRRINVIIIVLSVLLLLNSCVSYKAVSNEAEYNQTWRNATKNDIIRQIGVPSRIVEMDDGEYVIVYEQFSTYTSNTGTSQYQSYTNQTVYNGSSSTSQNRSYTEFYMNSLNRCYAVKTSDWHQEKDGINVGATLAATILGTLGVLFSTLVIILLSGN